MDSFFILGVTISIILAYWGIWHANKSKTKPQLLLIDQNTIPLISTFNENFKTLDLLNYKLPFNANQYYYRGTIINSGNTDIYRNIILQPLKISFPKDFKIISFNLGQKTPELNIEIKQENESIILQWDILKTMEHFTFELIIESIRNVPIYELPNKMKIDSRIADLDAIKKIDIGSLNSTKKNLFSKLVLAYLFVLLMVAISFFLLFSGIKSLDTSTGELHYSLVNKLSKKPVQLGYYNIDSVELIEGKNLEIVARKDLDNNVSVMSEVTIIKNQDYFDILIYVLGVVIFTFFIISMARKDIRNFHLKRILKSLSK